MISTTTTLTAVSSLSTVRNTGRDNGSGTSASTANFSSSDQIGTTSSQQGSSISQNSTALLALLQLIIRLLRQLQSNQNPEPKPLDLSAKQREGIQNHFGIFGEQNFSVEDKDGNKSLSAGDVVKVSGGVTGGDIREITLTQDDVDVINGKHLDDAKTALLENKEKWQALNANNENTSYTYTLERSGFIGPEARQPVDITVEGGNIVNSEFSDGSGNAVPEFNELTIDDLFNTIERAIDNGAAEVRVDYDSKTGIPTSIFIDQDRRIADEELFLKTSDFSLQINEEPPVLNLEVPLTSDEKKAIETYTGLVDIRVDDRDGNGKLSAGDTVVSSVPGAVKRDLTIEDINNINQLLNNNNGVVKGGGVSVGGENTPDDRIVNIKGQQYSVGFLKDQVADYAKSSYVPTGAVDEVFGIYKWGTSNSRAAGSAFEQYIVDTFPKGEPGVGVDNQKILDANKEKWDKSGITDYTYEFSRSCFCPPEITRSVDMTVKDGKVADAVYHDNQQPLSEASEINKQSVNGLFDIIQDAINAGQQVEVKYDKSTGMPNEIVIDRDQMPVDGGQTIRATNLKESVDEPNELNLSKEQHAAIGARFNRLPPPNLFDGGTTQYTGVTIDTNGDGKLGVGDTVKLRHSGGLLGLDDVSDHVLTAADMAFIEADRSNPLLDISNGLSAEQRQRLHDAISAGNISQSKFTVDSVFDANSDGKLSVGDSVQLTGFSNPPYIRDASNDITGSEPQSTSAAIGISLNFHTLTQADMDRYLKGSEPQNNELQLSPAQQAKVENVFNIRNAVVSDNNGDGKISAGDVVTGTLFRETGTISATYRVSNDNASHINGDYGNELRLPATQQAALNTVLKLNNDLEGIRGILDRDGSGRLSAGDVVYTRSNLATTGGDPIGGSPKYYHLSVADIKAIDNPPVVKPGLQEQLNYLDGKRFLSQELLEVGLSGPTGPGDPGGIQLGRWEISFDNGTYQRSYSDIGEAGQYKISGDSIILENGFITTRSVELEVFMNEDAIEFGGHRYLLEGTEISLDAEETIAKIL